jgi:hypothetical protein
MRISIWLVAGLLFAGLAGAATAQPATAPPGAADQPIPYAQARAQMLAQGFQPAPALSPEDTRCDDHPAFCAAWPELLVCNEDMAATCEFAWRTPGGKLMLVTTQMAPDRGDDVSRPKVDDLQPMSADRQAFYFQPRERLPRFRLHTPYAQVRAELIKAGYAPQPPRRRLPGAFECRIFKLCRTYPEAADCKPMGPAFCTMLFRRVRDGRIIVVIVNAEGGPDFYRIDFLNADGLKTFFPPPTRATSAAKRQRSGG